MIKSMPFAIALVFWMLSTASPIEGAVSDADPAAAPVQISGNANFPPYEFINAHGMPDGYNIELIKAVAAQADFAIALKLQRWADARRALETGQIDALTGVMYSPARDRVFDYSVPHIVISYAVFIHEDSEIESPQDARGRQVLVVKGVYAHDWLRKNDFTDRIVAVDDPEDALRRLASGQYDCAVLIRLHGLDLLRRLGIANVKTVGPPVLTQKMGFAVQAGNAELLAKLNEGLHLVHSRGEFDRIYRRWFSVYEERALRDRLLSAAKIAIIPVLGLLVAGALWIFTLNRSIGHKTEALRRNRQTLVQILEHLPVPTLVMDRHGRITHWNRQCVQLTGIAASEAVGRRPGPPSTQPSAFLTLLMEHCDDEDQRAAIRHRRPAYESGGTIVDAEVFVPWLGDEGKWLFGTVAPFEDGRGRRIGTIEAWQDLTDRKTLERQLIQAQKMEAMGTLAGSVAHDFASYLQAIGGYVSTAQLDKDLSAGVRSSLEGVRSTIAKARELIRQIMLFSHQDLVAPSPVDIRPIIERTLALVKTTAPANIRFETEIRTRAYIMADETKVSQVLLNLATNAVQAMTPDGGLLTVRTEDLVLEDAPGFNGRRRVSGPYLKLEVIDSGYGIPPDQLEKVFEPFFTRRRDAGGTGMGLAIVHGIVRGYDGRITVRSQSGRGTTFEVLWPAVAAG
jgi:two-component system sensor histidine kinase EvgS